MDSNFRMASVYEPAHSLDRLPHKLFGDISCPLAAQSAPAKTIRGHLTRLSGLQDILLKRCSTVGDSTVMMDSNFRMRSGELHDACSLDRLPHKLFGGECILDGGVCVTSVRFACIVKKRRKIHANIEVFNLPSF